MPGSVPDLVEDIELDPLDDLFPEVGDRRMRAFLAAYAEHGVKYRACAAAGISDRLIYTPRWRNNEAFQAAMKEAYKLSAYSLEDEARRRAVEGMRRYRFNRHGENVRHPELCECGHGLAHHPRRAPEDVPEAQVVDPETGREGIDYAVANRRPCNDPECVDADHPCTDFIGMPYYEHEYSDTLLKTLLSGARPDRYAKKTLEVKAMLAKLDVSKLPAPLVERIAAGEHPMAVLSQAVGESGLLEGGETPVLGPGEGSGGPTESGRAEVGALPPGGDADAPPAEPVDL